MNIDSIIYFVIALDIIAILIIAYPIMSTGQKGMPVSQALKNFEIGSMGSSCQGIFAYYSGKSFLSDVINLKRSYVFTDSSGGDLLDTPPKLLPPMALTYGDPDISCVDFSHFVGCLASMYPNVRCEPHLTDNMTHIYQVCLSREGNRTVEITL